MSQPDPPTEPTYTLGELTALTGVSPRTVRYYITEHLLPSPQTLGRHARYTHDHLERLHLIARLKAKELPLKDIRDTLHTMSRADIAAALRDHPHTRSTTPGAEPADWRRIPITADAELLVTTSAHLRHEKQLDAAVAWLRRILTES